MRLEYLLELKDLLKNLRRNDLIKKLILNLIQIRIKKDEYKLVGVLILFNNLLQSLV